MASGSSIRSSSRRQGNTAVRNSRRVRFNNRSDMIREFPADPVVQPRPRQYSKEELAAIKKEMLAEYNKSKQADVGADASVRPAPAEPVREADPNPAQATHWREGSRSSAGAQE